MKRLAAFRVALVAAFAMAVSACGINSVPTAEENAKARWADVQSAYQRRADLVPNLVSTVRAAANSEEEILTQVIEARAQATSTTINANELGDAQKFRAFEQAQGHRPAFEHGLDPAEPVQRILAETACRQDMRRQEVGLARDIGSTFVGNQRNMMPTTVELGRQRECRN